MSLDSRPSTSFGLSLAAGLLILLGSGVSMMWFPAGPGYWGPYGGMMGGYYGMMGNYYGMIGGLSPGYWFWGLTILEVVSGAVVLIGAFMLFNQPKQSVSWGTIVLIFSALSYFGMGGFFVGATLGIVGGILAIVWKPGMSGGP